MKLFINMIYGFCMALADSVPGVSGGTIAFILGFYDKFILSLNNLISGNNEERKEAILFLIKLMSGWIIGFVVSVFILTSIFNSHIYQLCSLFLGLSLFALPIIVKEEKQEIVGKYHNVGFAFIGVVVVGLITYFNQYGGVGAVDVLNLSIGNIIYIFVVAMIAISAMVLPGISGSTLLLIFGLYVPIITGIKEVLHFNFSYLPLLLVFGFGVITGILSVIKIVRTGLEKFRSQTIYLILGLMIGSVYAIVMGPTTLDVPQAAMSINTFSPIFFLLGGTILLVLQKLKKFSEKHINK